MGTIYLRTASGTLSPMVETDYINEAELQRLLAAHYDLLPGDQIDPEAPRRWLFIGREVGVPGGEDEADWLSLDHLYIDQDAIPTFVECKRARDTRSRREVVAQMLDYAANGTAYWTVARLQEIAAAGQPGMMTLDERVSQHIGNDAIGGIEAFWAKVAENLAAGRVRLMFVLDEAPRELRRLVEFLNEQMNDTEVLLLEVRQYKSQDGLQALVPHLIGRTEKAAAKHSARVTKISVAEVLAQLAKQGSDKERIAKELLDWSLAHGVEIDTTSKAFVPLFAGARCFRVSNEGKVVLPFTLIRDLAAFRSGEARLALLERFSDAAGERFSADHIDRKFGFPIERLSDPARMQKFKDTVLWFAEKHDAADD